MDRNRFMGPNGLTTGLMGLVLFNGPDGLKDI